MGVGRPQDGRLGPVHRDHAQVVVPGPGVIQRVALRIAGRRPLGQIARVQIRAHLLAGRAIEEVVVVVVSALANLDLSVLVDDHVGLAGPAGAAPLLGPEQVARRRTHPACLRVLPDDLRVLGERALAVVAAGRVAAERGQPRKARVDRTGFRRDIPCRARGARTWPPPFPPVSERAGAEPPEPESPNASVIAAVAISTATSRSPRRRWPAAAGRRLGSVCGRAHASALAGPGPVETTWASVEL